MKPLIVFLSIILINCFYSRLHSQELNLDDNITKKLDLINGEDGDSIRYGHNLFVNTAKFFGPSGKVFRGTISKISCSNCHLEAGNREFGNSLLKTHARYPQFRTRENEIQTLPDRINACFKHPNLGTKNIPESSKEMKALQMYIKWIGRNQVIAEADGDDRLLSLKYLKRAASIKNGQIIYENNCIQCHKINGEGQLDNLKSAYIYPPLWGNQSFMLGSSMSRLSILARFVKGNMPFGVKPSTPKISNEDAWDVSAYILSKKRPEWRGQSPFKNIILKPFDYPFGPYGDHFTNEQHKLGPFQPIIDFNIGQTKKINNYSTGI